MKSVTYIIIVFLFTTFSFGYENAKIDMHGGKRDSLLPKQGFSQNFQTLGSQNVEKRPDINIDRRFLEIEKVEKIEKEKEKNE